MEKQVAEIKNIREKEKAANNLDLQDKCSKESKEYFNEYLKDFDISSIYASYSNHYNSSLNKCFIQIKYNHDEILEWTLKGNTSSNIIFDVLERKAYAQFLSGNNDLINYCAVQGKFCYSSKEFDSGIKSFMEN